MAVSKKLRFEIFRRDHLRCRYCGRAAMDGAVLEADHVVPRCRGGRDTATNLVAACEECNAGKGATPMDAPVVEDVPEELFRRVCAERGILDPPSPPSRTREDTADTYDDGRLSFAYQILGKADQWDSVHWMASAKEAADGYEASQAELEVCAAVIGLEAVFDERERLRDIVMGFLKAVPNGKAVWEQAIANLKASRPDRMLTAIDITEEALALVLGDPDDDGVPA